MFEKIEKLEYHQKLLLKVIENPKNEFYKLAVEYSLGEREVRGFYKLCEGLSMKYQEQKAEGFVYYHPLFKEFADQVSPKFTPRLVISACIKQGIFIELMEEFRKYLD